MAKAYKWGKEQINGKWYWASVTDDDDDKLVLANKNYSDDAIEALTEFQERFFQHEIWR